MNFLQYAVWGAYLTSMGAYLGGFEAMRSSIGTFYAMQGLVSLFMPALMGIVADRWIEAQKLLSICNGLAAACRVGQRWLLLRCLRYILLVWLSICPLLLCRIR